MSNEPNTIGELDRVRVTRSALGLFAPVDMVNRGEELARENRAALLECARTLRGLPDEARWIGLTYPAVARKGA